MGSEKYPDENEFTAFVSKHSGSDNAHTDNHVTVYSFDISPSKEKVEKVHFFWANASFRIENDFSHGKLSDRTVKGHWFQIKALRKFMPGNGVILGVKYNTI